MATKLKPKPIALAMVICDMVIDDVLTRKKSLVGLFNNIYTSKVPTIHPRLNVYISLTEGYGDYDAELRCVNLDDNKTVGGMKGPLKFINPQQIIEFNFEIGNLVLPQYGNYRFDFLCNNELVISRKFNVTPTKKKESGGKDGV